MTTNIVIFLKKKVAVLFFIFFSFRIFQTETLTFQKLISERHENIKYKSRRIWKNMLLLYNKGVNNISQTVFVSKNIEISTCRTEVIFTYFFTI